MFSHLRIAMWAGASPFLGLACIGSVVGCCNMFCTITLRPYWQAKSSGELTNNLKIALYFPDLFKILQLAPSPSNCSTDANVREFIFSRHL
jgi:hypothetical protein